MVYEPISEYQFKNFWAGTVIHLCIDLYISTQVTCRIMKIDNLDLNFKRNAMVPFVFS